MAKPSGAKSPKVKFEPSPAHVFEQDGVRYTIAKDFGREICQLDIAEIVLHRHKTEQEFRRPKEKRNDALIAQIDRTLSEKPRLIAMRRKLA